MGAHPPFEVLEGEIDFVQDKADLGGICFLRRLAKVRMKGRQQSILVCDQGGAETRKGISPGSEGQRCTAGKVRPLKLDEL